MNEPYAPAARLLVVSMVARRLNMSDEYVYRLLRSGQLAAIRINGRWRIDPLQLDSFLRRHSTTGTDCV